MRARLPGDPGHLCRPDVLFVLGRSRRHRVVDCSGSRGVEPADPHWHARGRSVRACRSGPGGCSPCCCSVALRVAAQSSTRSVQWAFAGSAHCDPTQLRVATEVGACLAAFCSWDTAQVDVDDATCASRDPVDHPGVMAEAGLARPGKSGEPSGQLGTGSPTRGPKAIERVPAAISSRQALMASRAVSTAAGSSRSAEVSCSYIGKSVRASSVTIDAS